MVSNRNLLFQGSIFRGYVSFREGTQHHTTPHESGMLGIFFGGGLVISSQEVFGWMSRGGYLK